MKTLTIEKKSHIQKMIKYLGNEQKEYFKKWRFDENPTRLFLFNIKSPRRNLYSLKEFTASGEVNVYEPFNQNIPIPGIKCSITSGKLLFGNDIQLLKQYPLLITLLDGKRQLEYPVHFDLHLSEGQNREMLIGSYRHMEEEGDVIGYELYKAGIDNDD